MRSPYRRIRTIVSINVNRHTHLPLSPQSMRLALLFAVALLAAVAAPSASAHKVSHRARLDAFVAEAREALAEAKAANSATQVHIALTDDPTEMQVTWSTFGMGPSNVRYGRADSFPNLGSVAQGFVTKFVDNGTLHHTQYVHRATLEGLEGGQRYAYQVPLPGLVFRLFAAFLLWLLPLLVRLSLSIFQRRHRTRKISGFALLFHSCIIARSPTATVRGASRTASPPSVRTRPSRLASPCLATLALKMLSVSPTSSPRRSSASATSSVRLPPTSCPLAQPPDWF